MNNVTRRGFLAGSAVTAGLVGLAGCSSSNSSSSSDTTKGSGYTETDSGNGYMVVDNGENGKQLSYSPDSGLKLIEKDGYAFKDFEGTGELVTYEDWRLSADERAEDLASRISIDQICGLMCFSGHQSSIQDDCSVTDTQKEFLDGGVRAVLNAASGFPAYKQATWANAMQAYAESSDNKIPINFSSDPRQGKNCTNWPDNLGLAASFDPEVSKEAGAGIARDMREMGITMYLGPQTDVATDPRWARYSSTFGVDPALSRDMVRAHIDGLQSTLDSDGNDEGWGTGSLLAMVKHWPAEGAGEGGREGHTDGGKFAVYPKKNFEALTIPFVDGAFKLDGKTECAASIMTSYTIAFDEDMEYGEPVGSGFSAYKVKELLRDKYGFKGSACTDWAVLENDNDPDVFAWTCWGLENNDVWTPAKRAAKAVEVGVDQMGGCNDTTVLKDAYESMKSSLGEEKAEANFREVAKRLLLGYFNCGLFEDPYVDPANAKADLDKGDEDAAAKAFAAQVKGIVMLKNHGDVIKAASGSDTPKIYMPMTYTPSYETCSGMGHISWSTKSASCELPMSTKTIEKYFDLVTDTLADTLTGPADATSGEATPAEADLTRATAADIADVDAVVVIADPPTNANSRRGKDKDGNFIPLSCQYRPYTADGANVRQTSIAGDPADGTKWAEHDTVKGVEIENRSYYGRTSMMTNENMLDQILSAAALAKEAGKPCIVVLNSQNPMCVHEFESEVDAILMSMSNCPEAALDIIAGKDEPSGLLPLQMPKDMDTVEAHSEDMPRDIEPYTDVDGNSYDFGFGLNYKGVISDDRTKKYCVDPLTSVEG